MQDESLNAINTLKIEISKLSKRLLEVEKDISVIKNTTMEYKPVSDETFMYHSTLAPEGKKIKIVELQSLGKGWVDSPAKLTKAEPLSPAPAKEGNNTSPSETPSEVTYNISDKAEEVAGNLLSGEGFNHSSFTREMGLNPRNNGDREKTKPEYESILKKYEKAIKKQGNDFFFA